MFQNSGCAMAHPLGTNGVLTAVQGSVYSVGGGGQGSFCQTWVAT